MDGIYKKPKISTADHQAQKILKDEPFFNLQKKEELYITKEDIQKMNSRLKIGYKPKNKINYKKIIFTILIIPLFLFFFYLTFIIFKTHSITKKINFNSANNNQTITQEITSIISPIIKKQKIPLKGEDSGRINILLLGAAGENKPGGNLTDTIMIMSIDTENMKVSLFSLPRDLYVNIPNTDSYTKINSLYKIGLLQNKNIELIKKAVENIVNKEIDYYLILDFDGFKKIIDDMGGINVMVQKDIYDERYPGPNYSYETFSLEKGLHNLNGETALKYVRERHDDPEGDFGRAKRQQQVIQAVKNKLFSAQTIFNIVAVNDILNTVSDNLKTNITLDEFSGFVELSKNIDTQNINNLVVDAWKKESLLKVSHIQMGSSRAFVLVPRIGNYNEIQESFENIFNKEKTEKRISAIREENATIGIINRSSSTILAKKIQNLLKEKLGFNNVRIINETKNSQLERTKILDNSKGIKIFSTDELIKKIPATMENSFDANLQDDIILILGNDIVKLYDYEEVSLEEYQKNENMEE